MFAYGAGLRIKSSCFDTFENNLIKVGENLELTWKYYDTVLKIKTSTYGISNGKSNLGNLDKKQTKKKKTPKKLKLRK